MIFCLGFPTHTIFNNRPIEKDNLFVIKDAEIFLLFFLIYVTYK